MENLQDELTIAERLTAPTPKLFQTIRTIGVVLSVVSGALMGLESQGINLPPVFDVVNNAVTLVAGLIASLVASLTVDLPAYKKANALGR